MSKQALPTRDAILLAAHRIYLDEGLPGLSMRHVAREAGISATAIYRHFADKEEMLFHLVEEGNQQFLNYLSRGLLGTTPMERMQLCGQGYCDFALDHPSYYRILFMAPKEHLGLEKLNKVASESFGPTFTFLVDRVRECMGAKVMAKSDPERVAVMIWAHTHGLCSLRLSNHLDMLDVGGFRSLYNDSVSAFMRSLA